MLVNVKSDIETIECHLSSMQLSRLCKQSCDGRDSQPHCEADLTLREEVGFQSNFDTLDTHYPGIQGGLKGDCVCRKEI
jgi:hypothetical protein